MSNNELKESRELSDVAASAVIRDLFDYATLDNKEDADFLMEQARVIRGFGKVAAAAILQIGESLIAAKDRVGHGHFIPWIEAEFGWTKDTAQNYMRVTKRFKNGKFPFLDGGECQIDVSALYVLAAPSAPPAAAEQAVEIAAAGGKVTHKAAKLIVEQAKEAAAERPPEAPPVKLPSPKKANEIAQQKGINVIASDGNIYSGKSDKQTAAEVKSIGITHQLFEALEAIATMPESPEDVITRIPRYNDKRVNDHLGDAIHWLEKFATLWSYYK